MKAKWYRNPPEKDQDKPQGTGEIIHFGLLERTGEGVVVIVNDEGNLVEKPFSLVRIIVNPEVRAIENRLQEEAEQKYILENTKQLPEPVASKPEPTPVAVKPINKPTKQK